MLVTMPAGQMPKWNFVAMGQAQLVRLGLA